MACMPHIGLARTKSHDQLVMQAIQDFLKGGGGG